MYLSPPDDDNVQNAWNYTSTSPAPSWHVPGKLNFDSNMSSRNPTEKKVADNVIRLTVGRVALI
jgi:hypothetical protein